MSWRDEAKRSAKNREEKKTPLVQGAAALLLVKRAVAEGDESAEFLLTAFRQQLGDNEDNWKHWLASGDPGVRFGMAARNQFGWLILMLREDKQT